ncbi:hypothetical protein A2U01_0071572, partial [Trifolium medium]|nr:hypothetical protein [Trifolium medium]
EEVLVRPSLFGLSTGVFDHTVWVHDQNLHVSSYGYFSPRLGSSAGTHFVVADKVVVDTEESPMVTVSEALSRPVAGSMGGRLLPLIGFV